jgi:hypothetical protein
MRHVDLTELPDTMEADHDEGDLLPQSEPSSGPSPEVADPPARGRKRAPTPLPLASKGVRSSKRLRQN